MKIGIVTLPLHTNYGGILQCYALQTVLNRMGHDVYVLSRPQYSYSYYLIYPLAVCKRLIKRFLLGKKVNIFKGPYQQIVQHIRPFILHNIRFYYRRKWNIKIASCFDGIIVGSDQVWRPVYFNPIEEAFLSFLEGAKIKRVAYAASFGVDNCDEYTTEQLKNCSHLLKMFDAVSVREGSGMSLCRDYFGVEAVQMLDPTLLLDVNDYRVLIRKGNTQPSKGNMFVYILDRTEEKVNLVNQIVEKEGFTPFWVNNDEENISLPLEKRIKQPVEQWIRSFDDAEFVLTDSFHGCVFSILFRKNFIALGNSSRGLERFTSLLGSLGLSDRLLFSNYNSRYNELLCSAIDYNQVEKTLRELKKKSFDFISAI